MKKITIFVMMIALLAIGASALQVSDLSFGDNRQDRVKGVTATLTLTNNDTVTVTGISHSLSQGAEASKYAIQLTGVPSTLGPGKEPTHWRSW